MSTTTAKRRKSSVARRATKSTAENVDSDDSGDLKFIKVEDDVSPQSPPQTPAGTRSHDSQRIVHLPHDPLGDTHFMDNSIKTTKYTWYNFLFKNILMEQLRRIANFYFLCIAVLQMIPGMSNVTPASSITPLTFVIGVSAIKELIEDTRRGRSDKVVNNRECHIVDREASARSGSEQLSTRRWRDLAVGDIVKLEKDQMVPADLVILSSGLPQGLSFVETANLDGETNLKIFQALEQTVEAASPSNIGQFECTVFSEQPNNRLYVYEGSMKITKQADGGGAADANKELSLSAKQLLLRGCTLRNTPWVYGVVIFTGFDTKLMRNQTAAPSKRSSLEIQMNSSLLLVFLFMFICVFINALFSQIDVGFGHWYVHGDRDDNNDGIPDDSHFAFRGNIAGFFFNFGSFIVLFSSMIPISLYVTMELCKLVQVIFMSQDVNMYYEPKDQPAIVRTSNLTEELGQIEYIFSDKTGTLTQNSMVFNKCSVAECSYDVTKKGSKDEGEGDTSDNDKDSGGDSGSTKGSAKGGLQRQSSTLEEQDTEGDANDLSDATMRAHLAVEDKRGELLDQFWTLLAVCHTVIPESPDENGIPQSYQAESPDELALVLAAKDQDFVLVERGTNSVVILNHGVREEYRVLNINDFNSTRKRMSIVFECPDGQLRLMIKGADNVIKDRLGPSVSKRLIRQTDAHLERYSRAGLRTLLCGMRELDQEAYLQWNKTYHAASVAVLDRGTRMAEVAEAIEKDLELVGATAIEDKLQDDVPKTIANLGRAGIRLWVLTGDKIETAINIARSCNLISRDMDVARVTGGDPEPLLVDVIRRLQISADDFLDPSSASRSSIHHRGHTTQHHHHHHRHRSQSANNQRPQDQEGPPELALVLDGMALEVILGNKDVSFLLRFFFFLFFFVFFFFFFSFFFFSFTTIIITNIFEQSKYGII